MKIQWFGPIACVLVQLSACGGGGGSGSPLAPPAVAAITVAPPDPALTVGDSVQMTATVLDGAGGVIQGRSVTWGTKNESIVTVTPAGRVSAVGEGETQVTASIGFVQGATTVTVTAQSPSGPVSKVELDPPAEILEEGQSRQFTARAFDANGDELTGRGIRWTVSDGEIAAVDPGGLVTGLRNGMTTVRARIDGASADAGVRIETSYPFELVFSRASVGTGPELYTLDIRDAAAIAIPVFAAGQTAADPVAFPDGRRIAYVVGTSIGSAIHVANRDGSDPIVLVEGAASNDQPSWAPDGSQIAFRRREANGDADIWVVTALDGSGARNLTGDHGATNQSSPAWSPILSDGRMRIAYSHSANGQGHLWTMAADGSDKQVVTSSATAYDDEPSWSPDGSWIVFQRSDSAIFGDLYIVAATGGAGASLMSLAGPLAGPQFAPAWSPDGRLIGFASRHEGAYYQIYTVWFDGTRLARRTVDPMDHATPAWLMR